MGVLGFLKVHSTEERQERTLKLVKHVHVVMIQKELLNSKLENPDIGTACPIYLVTSVHSSGGWYCLV